MRGPPPTPNVLKLIRGNPGKRPLRPEPEPAIASECPGPPEFLTGYAADAWRDSAPELYRLGLLTVLDVDAFAVFCVSYGRWRTAEETLAQMAEHDTTTCGLLIKTVVGDARRNPLVKIAADAADAMLAAAGQFGMTPAARSRLAAGIGPPKPSKFDGLLA